MRRHWLLSAALFLGLLAAPPAEAAPPEGSLDKEEIRKVVRANIGDVRACYNSVLESDPDWAGRVAISFTIGPVGAVTATRVESTEERDHGLAQCVAGVIETWAFPAPEGGGNVLVTYPFHFAPG